MAKLYFNYAAMNAGKSTALLQSSFNYKERGMHTVIYTAAIDNRAATGLVASRIGLQQEARLFSADTDIFTDASNAHRENPIACIFVDEAQFLSTDQVMQLARIVDELNIPVLCFGLRTDFQGKLFDGSQRLLAIADELKELKTICACGSKATMNMRIGEDGRPIKDGESIEIGGNERYLPLCRKHFYERLNES